MDFAEQLRTLREARGLSRYRLAQLSELSETYIKKLEDGISRRPSGATLQRLARVLQVPITDLWPAEVRDRSALPGTEEMPPVLAAVVQRVGRYLTERDYARAVRLLEDLAAERAEAAGTAYGYMVPEADEDDEDREDRPDTVGA